MAPDESGASLVELSIAIIVIVVVLSAVLNLVVRTTKQRRVDDEMALAFAALSSNFEELRTLSPADLTSVNGVGFDVLSATGQSGGLAPVPGDPDNLPGLFSVVPVAGGPADLFEVRATVTWRGAIGDKSLELIGLMAERKR